MKVLSCHLNTLLAFALLFDQSLDWNLNRKSQMISARMFRGN